MTTCSAAGCDRPGAFATRTRPTWCTDHLHSLYENAGLTLREDFTKPSAYLLARCRHCGFEGHYRFNYILDKIQSEEQVCRACFWRSWAQMARSMSGLGEHKSDLTSVRRIAEAQGYTYLHPLTDPSLVDDPHATRCNACGKVEAQRASDIAFGCACARNPKSSSTDRAKSNTANLLKNSTEYFVTWWDHERNEEAHWKTAKLKSRREAWWICPENHSFIASIRDVTTHRAPCPECHKEQSSQRAAERAYYASKTVAEVPELLASWDDATPPDTVALAYDAPDYGYYFRCASGHRSRSNPLRRLDIGCPWCRGAETRRANQVAAAQDPNFSRLTQEISSQWHPSRNGRLLLSSISPESRRQIWWLDPICGHEFQATPRERDKYDRWRCPICRTILDSLAYHYPEIAEEWSPENAMSAWHVRPHDTKLLEAPLWVCRDDASHTWRSSPSSRVNGSTCPECRMSGKSKIELAYADAATQTWGDVKSGARLHSKKFERHASWTVDILVQLPDQRSLAIEYDGSYWHRDKLEVDRQKSLDLLADGNIVVRLREAPLPSLGLESADYYELVVYAGAQEPIRDVEAIAALIGTANDPSTSR